MGSFLAVTMGGLASVQCCPCHFCTGLSDFNGIGSGSQFLPAWRAARLICATGDLTDAEDGQSYQNIFIAEICYRVGPPA